MWRSHPPLAQGFVNLSAVYVSQVLHRVPWKKRLQVVTGRSRFQNGFKMLEVLFLFCKIQSPINKLFHIQKMADNLRLITDFGKLLETFKVGTAPRLKALEFRSTLTSRRSRISWVAKQIPRTCTRGRSQIGRTQRKHGFS